ncbi:recombinase family protein [Streptomyces sp. NPDC051940]|uniref:recombinase family protein n=1 Tax=Streptomyces sp. NPDC051940 TaxID=3155675 RepID=UPI0034191078
MSADDPEGVDRRRRDCTELAAARGWVVGKVYVDNDASAYKERRVRPGFEELLEDLGNEALDGVVTSDLDRVARRPLDLERLIDVYERSSAPLVFATLEEELVAPSVRLEQRRSDGERVRGGPHPQGVPGHPPCETV